jgi:DNA invertase Pin-like site-specific DNA recombinase
LKEYCKKNNLQDVINLADSATSGGKMLFHRPEGSKLRDLEFGDKLIVCRPDRLFRNFINAVNVTHDLVNRGVEIYFIQVNSTPVSFENYNEEFKLYLDYALAHMDKRKIGANTKNGLKNKRLKGETNSKAKFGFNNVYYEVNGKKVGKEEPNEYEQETLVMMNKFRSTINKGKRMSGGKVAEKLNALGRFNKSGEKWLASNIDTALFRANNMHVFEKHGVKYWRDVR